MASCGPLPQILSSRRGSGSRRHTRWAMYGPPPDCKRKVRMRRNGLRQCIRPVMKLSLLAMMYSAPCFSYQACRHRVPCPKTGYELGRFDLFSHQFFCTQYRGNFIRNRRRVVGMCESPQRFASFPPLYVAVRYCWPVVKTAQAMRAILLAKATTATWECFLASRASIQEPKLC
jgi:hypothetical protein